MCLSHVLGNTGCKVYLYLSNRSTIDHNPYFLKVEKSQTRQFTVNHARFYPYKIECVFGLGYHRTKAHSEFQGP